MKVWVVTFDPSSVKNATFDDVLALYLRGLDLVDLESQIKIKKFYRRADAFRSLVGRLLPRMLLHEEARLSNDGMSFGKTQANKPYVNIPASGLREPIGFNVTHDGGVIAMAYVMGADQPWNDPPAHRIGIDIMKLCIPDRFTFQSFVNTVGDALTSFEKSSLNPQPPVAESESLHHFYLIWTIKEAYTKALGLGLGFDFKRIEYDNAANRIKVDGRALKGWEFDVFQVPGDRDGALGYIGVASKYVGGDGEAIIRKNTEIAVLTFSAEEFVARALRELGSDKP